MAKAGVTSAKASLLTANTAYAQAKDAEGNLDVTAPCGGTVWQVNVEAGDPVSTGSGSSSASNGASTASASGSSGSSSGTSTGSSSNSVPVTIARDSEMAVKLSVNEVDIPSLAVGQAAELTFDAVPDLTITGKVD